MLEAVELSPNLSPFLNTTWTIAPPFVGISERVCIAHLPARISDLAAGLANCARTIISMVFGIQGWEVCRLIVKARSCGDTPFKLITSLMVKTVDT